VAYRPYMEIISYTNKSCFNSENEYSARQRIKSKKRVD
jgi:hypothetical protein